MIELFDEEYFERGLTTNKSLYVNYRWIPELTIPLCHHIVKYCNILNDETILDFGCAKGYLVYGFRLLGYNAYGIDISEYAISCAPKEIAEYVEVILPLQPSYGYEYDWVICKDILEHVPYEDIDIQLDILNGAANNMLVMVPLGDGKKYYVDAYEYDTTHIIREDLNWWTNKFIDNGFNVEIATYNMGFFKQNWQDTPNGNGLFLITRK